MPGALCVLGRLALAESDYVKAEAIFHDTLGRARELGDLGLVAITLHTLDYLVFVQGDQERAARLCQESLALARELQDKEIVAFATRNLACIAHATGDDSRARALYRECVPVFKELGNRGALVLCLTDWVEVSLATLAPVQAVRLLAAVAAYRGAQFGALDSAERAQQERCVSAAHLQLDDAAFAVAWAAGNSMTRDQAVEEVLAAAG